MVTENRDANDPSDCDPLRLSSTGAYVQYMQQGVDSLKIEMCVSRPEADQTWQMRVALSRCWTWGCHPGEATGNCQDAAVHCPVQRSTLNKRHLCDVLAQKSSWMQNWTACRDVIWITLSVTSQTFKMWRLRSGSISDNGRGKFSRQKLL